LGALASAAGDGVLLWRGGHLDGSDVDLVVLDGFERRAADALRSCGLTPAPQSDGRLVWRSLDAARLEIDTLPARGWPPSYPSLAGVVDRSAPGPAGLLVASAPDVLLIRGAEALAGRPVEPIARRAQQLLGEPGARARLGVIAGDDGAAPIARLIADPEALRARARRGRLPYGVALQAALRSPRARAALRDRIAGRLGSPRSVPPPATRPGQAGALVALSGMDGSGKSSAALELLARVEGDGRAAMLTWNRFASESALLALIASPMRRLLRRSGPIADPVATDGSAPDVDSGHCPARRGPVAWVWIVVVALVNARSCRRAAAPRHRGVVVICDRWLPDALVDLEVRYGRHRVAEWILRRAVPRPDVALFLRVDAATSAARKPGDQAPAILAAMAEHYDRVTRELGYAEAPAGRAISLDATGERTEVASRVQTVVAAALASG
jgi:thymidylate kinase